MSLSRLVAGLLHDVLRLSPHIPVVMPGLDPGIHPSSKGVSRRRWIAGSSPAMTACALVSASPPNQRFVSAVPATGALSCSCASSNSFSMPSLSLPVVEGILCSAELDRRKRVGRSLNAGPRRAARDEHLACFLGLAGLVARGDAALLQAAGFRPALGLLRLRRRRRIDDRRQDVMARHGLAPKPLRDLAGDSPQAASYKSVIRALPRFRMFRRGWRRRAEIKRAGER